MYPTIKRTERKSPTPISEEHVPPYVANTARKVRHSGLYILYDKNTVILSDMIKTILFDLLSKKVNEDEND